MAQDHSNTLSNLNQQVVTLYQDGRYEKAIAVALHALGLAEKTLGPEHPKTATSLNNLGLIYDSMGNYAQAEFNYRRALKIMEKTLGPTHPDTATSINNLGVLYINMGEHARAEHLLRRALKITDKALGLKQLDTVTSLNNLGALYLSMGTYARAEPLFQRALKITEKIRGPQHPDTAECLNNLGTLYDNMGDYSRAEHLHQRALRIREKALGPEHLDTAITLNNLGALYISKGDYASAEHLYRRALKIKENTLGPTHPDTATSLNNLGLLYNSMGDYQQAKPLLQRALKIREKTLGPTHPDTATSLNNLGLLYNSMGDYTRAEPLCQRALDISEKALGPEHLETADVLDNLGNLYSNLGDYARADPFYRRALEIKEKALGPEHPETARVLNNLGTLYVNMGNYAKAEPLFRRALKIWEKTLGAKHLNTATSLNNLAYVNLDLGNLHAATKLALDLQKADIAALANILSFTSERQRLAYQETLHPYSLVATLGDAQGIASATLHFKGIVLDSLLEDRLVAAISENPKDQAAVDELRSLKQRYTHLLLEVPSDVTPQGLERHAARRLEFSKKVEKLESALARRVAGLGRVRRAVSVTVDQVQHAVPEKTTLVELLRYGHYFGKRKSETHYGAILLGSSNRPQWVDIGAADMIDKNIARYQTAVRGNTSDDTFSTILRALYQQIWAPIEAALPSDTGTVILSPDAQLNFLSFATLLSPDDEFLAQKYSLRYVTSGRDLLYETTDSSTKRMELYANPDFTGSKSQPLKKPADRMPTLNSVERRDLQGLVLPPLPGTSRERRSLESQAKRWQWPVTAFEGNKATETQLQATRSPRILHLATHGFFLPETKSKQSNTNRFGRGIGGFHSLDRPNSTGLSPGVVLHNPMHRSGLALAGAQTTLDAWKQGNVPPSDNDGIVTAEEVGGFHLNGTWLVTLSACDTGTGEARSGEGVLGLRRGFIQAGAQNLLMTLWSVADQPTADFMADFYEKAHETGNAPKALADVQRDWLVRLRKERGLTTAVTLAGPFILNSQGCADCEF